MTARASTVVRASRPSGKYSAKTLLYRPKLRVSSRYTVTFTTSERWAPSSARMRLMPSMVQRVSSSMLPTHMLPFSSLATCPETKMKSPARTAGWNGRFGFRLPIGFMSLSFSLICPPRCDPIVALQDRGLDDVDAALPVDQVAQPAIVDGHVVRRRDLEPLRWIRLVEPDLARRIRIGDVEQPQPL